MGFSLQCEINLIYEWKGTETGKDTNETSDRDCIKDENAGKCIIYSSESTGEKNDVKRRRLVLSPTSPPLTPRKNMA